MLLLELVGEGEPGQDGIFGAGERALEVVADAGRDAEARSGLDLVLKEGAGCDEVGVEAALALLEGEGDGRVGLDIRELGEGVGALAVGVVFEDEGAEVGELEAELELVDLVGCPGDDVADVGVVLSLEGVGLRAAAVECSLDDECGCLLVADGAIDTAFEDEGELVDGVGAEIVRSSWKVMSMSKS